MRTSVLSFKSFVHAFDSCLLNSYYEPDAFNNNEALTVLRVIGLTQSITTSGKMIGCTEFMGRWN